MNDNTRAFLAVVLVFVALFYNKQVLPSPFTPSKIEEPTADAKELVKKLPSISDNADSNKLAGVFYGISEKFDKVDVKSNLQLQYFLDFVGKKSVGDELKGKYPAFAPTAAELITAVVGSQTETELITPLEKIKLKELFHGFAWKLYKSDKDEVFEQYKTKSLEAIKEFSKEDDGPTPDDSEECICEGKGYIVHGDGHRTDCPCVESGQNCKHKPKCGSTGMIGDQNADKTETCICNTQGTRCGCIKKYGVCRCDQWLEQQTKTSQDQNCLVDSMGNFL